MELNPHNLDDNWPLTYADGVVTAGQPDGAGWNVTRNVVGFMDVYYQGAVAPERLVEVVHQFIRALTTAPDQAVLLAKEHPLAVGLSERLNFTFPGQGLKLGGRPNDPTFVSTEVVPTIAVWHDPAVSLDTLTVVLRLNIQLASWAEVDQQQRRTSADE